MSEKSPAAKMAEDWDQRAKENAMYYIASSREDWTEEEFFASGRETFDIYIRPELEQVAQGRDLKTLRVLEIGCGVGRVTRALADVFGEVWAVDVSAEMIGRARQYLADRPNANLVQTDGRSLSGVPEGPFDFAYSHLVFQHIPSLEAIRGYILETGRRLRPGGLFKFQVQGAEFDEAGSSTWLGVTVPLETARELVELAGLELERYEGEGAQEFWVWAVKRP